MHLDKTGPKNLCLPPDKRGPDNLTSAFSRGPEVIAQHSKRLDDHGEMGFYQYPRRKGFYLMDQTLVRVRGTHTEFKRLVLIQKTGAD